MYRSSPGHQPNHKSTIIGKCRQRNFTQSAEVFDHMNTKLHNWQNDPYSISIHEHCYIVDFEDLIY